MNKNISEETKLLINKITNELSQLFKVEVINPSIHIVNSRAEMDKVKGRQTESWLVGTVSQGFLI